MGDDPINIIPFDSKERQPKKISTNSMNSELVEQASEVIQDPQILINLVSKRTKELSSGKSPLIQPELDMSMSDIALHEIIEGKVSAIIDQEVLNQ